jgi:hypothetical protein
MLNRGTQAATFLGAFANLLRKAIISRIVSVRIGTTHLSTGRIFIKFGI